MVKWPLSGSFGRRAADASPLTERLEVWAHKYVPIHIGFGVALSQEANKVLRNCQIGKVTKRAAQ